MQSSRCLQASCVLSDANFAELRILKLKMGNGYVSYYMGTSFHVGELLGSDRLPVRTKPGTRHRQHAWQHPDNTLRH